LFPEF
jgi:hypothetical protein